ncbi:hypothetical protein BCR34DRAFT_634981 [Clohesyomyces aquaticus]|uniref:RBR-type E3 ubiquitin transferase n=1 Tax=Clohesyomyces aquaticus TaxID=1231657 RepID=A0A1Y1Z0X7_9PLEO|nr:hypothetical protein BCR34DRAFT_634981 [Clohesyomyces aquaticus]
MAPTTRLKENPDRKVDYSGQAHRGQARKASTAGPAKANASATAAASLTIRTQNPGPLTAAAGVAKKSTAKDKQKEKSASEKAPVPRAKARTCLLCAAYKQPKAYSRPGESVCRHFVDTCRLWDNARLHRLLRSDENFITCLHPDCGAYFSIEDCASQIKGEPEAGKHAKGKGSQRADDVKIRKQAAHPLMVCPVCDFQMCGECNRPAHKGKSCDAVKEKENQESEKAMTKLGTKPCPKCGVRIEKTGGCNHMHSRPTHTLSTMPKPVQSAAHPESPRMVGTTSMATRANFFSSWMRNKMHYSSRSRCWIGYNFTRAGMGFSESSTGTLDVYSYHLGRCGKF